MKKLPFNLEKALAGEPVVTRDGREIEQIAHFPTAISKHELFACVSGFVNSYCIDGKTHREDGVSGVNADSNLDLFMKQKTITVNGFEVPAPLDSDRDVEGYFLASTSEPDFYDICGKGIFLADGCDFIGRGIAHTTREAAVAHAKAMLGINPEEEA